MVDFVLLSLTAVPSFSLSDRPLSARLTSCKPAKSNHEIMSSWKNLWAVKLINRPDNWTSSWHSLSSFPVGEPFVSLFLTIHRKKCTARRLSCRNEAIAKTNESTILSYFSWIAQKCVESSSFPFFIHNCDKRTDELDETRGKYVYSSTTRRIGHHGELLQCI